MLARVLFVLLAGVPACWGATYSDYYDADGGNEEVDFYDSYNDEIQAPTVTATVMDTVTRIKKRGLEDIRTLNAAEIIDVKGALHNILHRTTPESAKGRQAVVRDYSDSYDYLENSNGILKDSPVHGDRPNGNILFKKWLPTFQVKNWSPTAGAQESMAEYPSQPDQRWSNVYQPGDPSYSRKNDIIGQIRKMVPVFNGEVVTESSFVGMQTVDPVDIQTSSIDAQTLHPTPDIQSWATTADNSESTQYNVMFQQESTYSNSEVQAEVRKLVPHWNLSSNVQHQSPLNNVPLWNISDNILYRRPPGSAQHWRPNTEAPFWNISGNILYRTPGAAQHWRPTTEAPFWNISGNILYRTPGAAQHWRPTTEAPFWNISGNILYRTPGAAQHWRPTTEAPFWNISGNILYRTPGAAQHWSPTTEAPFWNISDNTQFRTPHDDGQHWSPTTEAPFWNIIDNTQFRTPHDDDQHWSPTTEAPFLNISNNILHHRPPGSAQHWNPTDFRHHPSNVQHWSPSDNVRHRNSSINVEHWNSTEDVQGQNATTVDETYETGGVLRRHHKNTTTTSTTTHRVDIDAILEILANLTYDYEWNLTDEFNKTLIKHGIPTCASVFEPYGPGGEWTAYTNATMGIYEDEVFENASVVSKCFVCGLSTWAIPRDAYCADAFAGDFLPLMPVDPRSRGKIASYRKYCRYLDAYNYVEDDEEPRSIYGRFTGGCAVRWTDITGIYTQRTCRSKYRPLMGKHFASKRMAKLELALVNVQDGCIISPMATLLPVSRGISLYARFHACVCSANWCNRATHAHSSLHSSVVFVLACWLAHYT